MLLLNKVLIEKFKKYFIALTPKQFEELNRFLPLQSTLSTSATTKAGAQFCISTKSEGVGASAQRTNSRTLNSLTSASARPIVQALTSHTHFKRCGRDGRIWRTGVRARSLVAR